MAEQRRSCSTCKLNRAERFFIGPKARVCVTCQKRNRSRYSRDRRLQETYGITIDDYDALFEQQGGVCGICGGSRKANLDVDHDHAVEKQLLARGFAPLDAKRYSLRGLLCKRCNRRLLPSARDSIDTLQAAAAYLADPPAEHYFDERIEE